VTDDDIDLFIFGLPPDKGGPGNCISLLEVGGIGDNGGPMGIEGVVNGPEIKSEVEVGINLDPIGRLPGCEIDDNEGKVCDAPKGPMGGLLDGVRARVD
jgi:hypothetical protein